MKPSSAKAKGRKLQQWVRDKIIAWFDLTPDDVRSTSMGASGVDVTLSRHAKECFPFAIECKSRASMAIYKDYEQAEQHAKKETGEPIVVIKANNKNPLVVIDAVAFFEMAYIVHIYRTQQEK